MENKGFLIPTLHPYPSTDRQIFQIRHSAGIKIEETRVALRMNERTNERMNKRVSERTDGRTNK